MGQILSRNLFYTTLATVPVAKKAAGTLSTGAIAYIEGDPFANRQDGTTGGGTQRLHLYVLSADRTNVSAPVFFSYSDSNSNSGTQYTPRFSMAVDAANNVHCVYIFTATDNNQQSLRYRKATYSGGAFTWGTEQIISAYSANRRIGAIDIDLPGTTTDFPMVVACYYFGSSGSYTFGTTVYNKTSSGWNQQALPVSTSIGGSRSDVAIACKQDATSGGDVPTYVVTYNPGPLSSGMIDTGDYVFAHRAVVGGAFTGSIITVNQNLGKNLNGGIRNYSAYYLQNDFFLVYGEQQTSPNQYWWAIIKVNPTSGAVSNGVAPRLGNHTSHGMFKPAFALGSTALYRLGSGYFAFASYTIGTNQPIRSDIFLTYSGGVWSYREPATSILPAAGMTNSATIKMVYTGDGSRFTNAQSPMCITHFSFQGTTYVFKSWLYTKSHMQSVQSVGMPTDRQVVGSNQINAKVNVVYAAQANDQTSPTYNARVQIQLATNSAFTSGLYLATQTTSQERPYGGLIVSVGVDLSGYPLSQTTWYMRARMIDSLGNVSQWTTTRVFRVSHPAVPNNGQPEDNGIVPYINNTTSFNWDFADPFAYDYQYAYQVVLRRSSDNSVAYDTGKIISGNTYLNVDLGSGNLETYYDWYLTLWDSENVAGPVTYMGNFLFTSQPNPTWNTPASEGATLTTAIPVISWNPGVGNIKVQVAYRVVIRQGVTLVYDSGNVNSSDNTHQIPAGRLHNNSQYQIDVQIADSVGLGSTITRFFGTSWTAPVQPPSPVIYTGRHDVFGYVAVRIDESTIDANALYYSLYRRSLDREKSAWQLLANITDLSGFAIYLDYLCPGGVMNEYLVTQTADRFGDTVESSFVGAPVSQYASPSASFWLIDATEPARSCQIPNATAHSYTDEYEKTNYVVINGGNQVEEGEHVGISGSVSSQIRPRWNNMGNRDIFNLAANSNMLLNAAGNPDGGYTPVDSGLASGLSFTEVTAVPGPGNRGTKKFGMSVTKSSASATQINAGMTDTFTPTPYMSLVSGTKYNVSGWFNIPKPVAGYEVRLRVAWYYQGVNQGLEYVALGSDLTQVGVQASDSQTIGVDTWYRINKVCTVPTSCDEARLSIIIVSTGSTVLPTLQVFMEGLQITQGSLVYPYLSGYDYINGIWTGVENYDPVYSPGFISPRWVKQSMEYLRRSGHDLYLRSPFGDIWKVYVNDLAISNVAGTGPTEFVDMEIPYMQVR